MKRLSDVPPMGVGMDNTCTGVILSTKVVPDYSRITVYLLVAHFEQCRGSPRTHNNIAHLAHDLPPILVPVVMREKVDVSLADPQGGA